MPAVSNPSIENHMLKRRINKALKILREYGLGPLVRVLLERVRTRGGRVDFDRVSNTALKELEDSDEVVRALVNGVSYVYGMGVAGDIAEFGTMTGKSAVAIAIAASRLNVTYIQALHGKKRVWFFDSFEGLPEARFDVDRKSQHVASGCWARGTCTGLDEPSFRKLISKYLNPKDFLVYKGWFKDTVPLIDDTKKFSMLHIDSDLYESAIDVLDTLFKRRMIADGAIVFFDDWNCNAAQPALGERRAWKEVCERYRIVFSDAGSYSVACHKFIVHSYS
jgi:hypothetical protein